MRNTIETVIKSFDYLKFCKKNYTTIIYFCFKEVNPSYEIN